MPSVVEMRNYVAIIAWEMGLDDANDDVVSVATQAVQVSWILLTQEGRCFTFTFSSE